jgi:hypothetical protein
MSLGSIFVDAEHIIEVGAEDALKLLSKEPAALAKIEAASPKVAAALGVLLGGVGSALVDVEGAAATPLNITLDTSTWTALKAVWPEVQAFLATIGVKV